MTCVAIFAAGAALCGGAPNIDALIGGRLLSGVGTVGLYAGAIFFISMYTTEEERYDDQPMSLMLARSISE
jgi:MFS family permease